MLGTGCCLGSQPQTDDRDTQARVPPTAWDAVLLSNGHGENLRPATPPRGREGSRDSVKHTVKTDRAGLRPRRDPSLVPPNIPSPPNSADGVGGPAGDSQPAPDTAAGGGVGTASGFEVPWVSPYWLRAVG